MVTPQYYIIGCSCIGVQGNYNSHILAKKTTILTDGQVLMISFVSDYSQRNFHLHEHAGSSGLGICVMFGIGGVTMMEAMVNCWVIIFPSLVYSF